MKLARLYIPKYPNYQVKLLEDRLIECFGGYTLTSTFGVGAWKNPNTKAIVQEPVYVYDVVLEDEHAPALEVLLQNYKEEAEQVSVLYILDNTPIFL